VPATSSAGPRFRFGLLVDDTVGRKAEGEEEDDDDEDEEEDGADKEENDDDEDEEEEGADNGDEPMAPAGFINASTRNPSRGANPYESDISGSDISAAPPGDVIGEADRSTIDLARWLADVSASRRSVV